MKKYASIVFTTIMVLGMFLVATNALALDPAEREALKDELKQEIQEEMKGEGEGVAGWIQEHISIGGLIKVGAAWQSVKLKNGNSNNGSDICLTAVELGVEAEVNDWVSVETLLLYEDPTDFLREEDEGGVELDEGIVTIGNTEEFPLYAAGGKMYVPFGALLTHFPDDPLMDVPLTLMMGEINEKAVLLGAEWPQIGFSVSGYLFRGDMNEVGKENHIKSYGFDANYSNEDLEGLDLLVGASYLSNIADSDGLEGALNERGIHDIEEFVGGFDAYLHVGFAGFFVDGEYMTALDDIRWHGSTSGPQPAVWNVEAGYNWDWGRNLEIALKYAASDEAEDLGYPETRLGICFNQEIFEKVTASVAYLHDEYEDYDIDDRDKRDVVYGQIAVEF